MESAPKADADQPYRGRIRGFRKVRAESKTQERRSSEVGGDTTFGICLAVFHSDYFLCHKDTSCPSLAPTMLSTS